MIRAGAWAALLLLVAAPLIIVLGMGFGTSAPGVPPVVPPIGAQGWQGSFEAWGLLVADSYYLDAALRSCGQGVEHPGHDARAAIKRRQRGGREGDDRADLQCDRS